MWLRVGLLLMCALAVVGCTATQAGKNAGDTEQVVRDRANLVMQALQAEDGKMLASLAHPGKGVRFSPYAYVRTEAGGDLVFKPAQLRELGADQTRYQWGTQDGTGHPIEATLSEYLKRFARDYLTDGQVGYNQMIKQGNSKINIHEAYPEGVFVEFYLPGTGEQADFTWSSVRLVFEEERGEWYLVGVIDDQWTM